MDDPKFVELSACKTVANSISRIGAHSSMGGRIPVVSTRASHSTIPINHVNGA